MSAMVLNPPNTRLLIGQDIKASLGSTSVTSIVGSNMRMYFAAVAPPYPPPTTTTLARAWPPMEAQPPNVVSAMPAAPVLRKSRLLIFTFFLLSARLFGKIIRQRFGFSVRVALGDLVHDCGLAFAFPEFF